MSLRTGDPTPALVAAWALSAVAAQTTAPGTLKAVGLGPVAAESLASTERGLVAALLLLPLAMLLLPGREVLEAALRLGKWSAK